MWFVWNFVVKYGMYFDSYNLDIIVLYEWSCEVYFKFQIEKLVKEWLEEVILKID